MATMNAAFLTLPRRLRFSQTKPENTEADLAVINNVHLALICPAAFCPRSLMVQGKTRTKTTTQRWIQLGRVFKPGGTRSVVWFQRGAYENIESFRAA